MPCATHTGTFRMETPAYGFISKIATGCEKPDDNLPEEVFLRAAVARETLGNSGSLLKNLNGRRVSFHIRPSELHPGKMEAFNIKEIEHPYPL